MRRTGHTLENRGRNRERAICQCGWTSPEIPTLPGRQKAHQNHLLGVPAPRCKVDGCANRPNARGMCATHYSLWRLHGAPARLTPEVRLQHQLATRPFASGPDAAERFWARVEREAPDECWTWLGSIGADGYGVWSYRGRVWRAHRVAYELTVGPIGYEMSIDHLCQQTLCVNPAHLEPCTLAENSRRQRARQTTCKRGHPRTVENLYPRPDGYSRQCRQCIRIRSAAQEERRKATKRAAA